MVCIVHKLLFLTLRGQDNPAKSPVILAEAFFMRPSTSSLCSLVMPRDKPNLSMLRPTQILWWRLGLVTNSIIIPWRFTIKDWCQKVCISYKHNQDLHQTFFPQCPSYFLQGPCFYEVLEAMHEVRLRALAGRIQQKRIFSRIIGGGSLICPPGKSFSVCTQKANRN